MEQRKRAFGQEESYEELSEKYTSMHLFATRYVKYHRMIQPHMAAAGISAAESHVLILITDHPGLTVSEMAKMMGCTAGAVSQILGKLEKTKLARREKQEGNAKEVHLYATPAGERAAQEHKAYSTGHTAQLLAAVDDCTEEEKEAFFNVLDRLGDFYGRLLELPREGEPS